MRESSDRSVLRLLENHRDPTIMPAIPNDPRIRHLSEFLGGITAGTVVVLSALALSSRAAGPSPGDDSKSPSTSSPTLESRLMPLIKAHQGKVAVAVKSLAHSGGDSFRYHADEVMPTASLIKFPVMIEAYRQAAAKEVDLDSFITLKKQDKVPGSGVLTYHFSDGVTIRLRDAVRLMIAYSDNTATNLVLDAIGIGATAATMEKMGYPHTKIHAKVFRRDTSVFPERSKQYGLGSTMPDEMIRLCEAVYRKRILSPGACDEMLEHLRACDDKDKFPRLLPPQTKVAFKTGSLADTRTAAGIIECPAGPVAICVMSYDNQDKRAGCPTTPAIGSAPRSPGPSTTTSIGLGVGKPRARRPPTTGRDRCRRPSPQDHRQGLRLAIAVDARQRRMALGQQDAVAEDVILVDDLDVGHPRDGGAHGQQVVVVRRLLELAADIDDHQEMAGILDLPVGDPPTAEHLGPGHLEVDEVIGMVQ
jgi:beta-lactamase class A